MMTLNLNPRTGADEVASPLPAGGNGRSKSQSPPSVHQAGQQALPWAELARLILYAKPIQPHDQASAVVGRVIKLDYGDIPALYCNEGCGGERLRH
jgi:hypothetical protein